MRAIARRESLPMNNQGPDANEVKAHYANLSATYARRANKACERAYANLISRWLGNSTKVLELGAGQGRGCLLPTAQLSIACDLSIPMLQTNYSNSYNTQPRVAADAAQLPYGDSCFDAVFSINLLEHVSSPQSVFDEVWRVLVPGGLWLTVTPNGDVAKFLDVLEQFRLKLPEGPHRFLKFSELAQLPLPCFEVLTHRRFLAFPAGPPVFVNTLDALTRWGLFQYLVCRKLTKTV